MQYSLEVLGIWKRRSINRTKAGLGLGEKEDEVLQTMEGSKGVNLNV
jgi:lipoate synthase